MRRIIFALIFCFSTAAQAQSGTSGGKPIELAPDAPDRHIVVRGDTLWGIAAKFLKDPFRWPDIWRMNDEQIKNPHRIYPGQVVILDRSGADPQLKLGEVVKLEPQVRIEGETKEIPAIPPQVIEPFLAQPLVIDLAQFASAPRIIAVQEGRVLAGNGDQVFASGLDPKSSIWHIYQPGRPLIDPDGIDPDTGKAEDKDILGVEAVLLGTARRVGEQNGISTLAVTSVKQEIGVGDYLVAANRPEIVSYVPRKPSKPISGRIMTLFGGDKVGGGYSVVTISRGKQDGLELGHVLAIYRAGQSVTNRFDDGQRQTHQLPDERYGLAFVFRVFDRVAYALVVDASRPVLLGDRLITP